MKISILLAIFSLLFFFKSELVHSMATETISKIETNQGVTINGLSLNEHPMIAFGDRTRENKCSGTCVCSGNTCYCSCYSCTSNQCVSGCLAAC